MGNDSVISSKNMLAGALLAIGSSMCFTGKVIVAKLAYVRGIDPLGLVLLRMVFASPFYVAILLASLRRGKGASKRDMMTAILLGLLCYYFSSMLDFTGIQYISTALERMILQLSPSFVVLISVLIFGRKLNASIVSAIAIGYAGVAIMVISEMGNPVEGLDRSGTWLGAGLIVMAAMSFATYVVGAERVMGRMDSRLFTSVAMSGACGGVFVHYLVVRGGEVPTHDPVVCALGLTMAVFCTVLPSFMVNKAIHLIGGQRIGPFNYVGMGLTFVISALVLDETFTLMKLSGILLASAGAITLTMTGRKKT